MIFSNPSLMSHVPRPLEGEPVVIRPFGWLVCTILLVANGTLADAPAWWQTRGVLKTNAVPNDYAALNVGQLKQIAFAAWQELETTPGGAGFLPTFTNAANNYAAVNVGQLKAVACPFYDRLIAAGSVTNYPWANSPSTNNYAIANIGQAKKLFSFVFTLDLLLDSDGDGMPDAWEIANGFDPNNDADAAQDADGDGLSNLDEYLLGTPPRSAATPPPARTQTSAPVYGPGVTGLLILTPSPVRN